MSLSALRILIPILFLVTLYLSQRYWVRSARRAIAAIRRPRWRALLRVLWTTLGILLLLAVVERFVAFRNHAWPTPGISRWSSEFLGLWFTWSLFAFLVISAVRGLDWLWRKSAGLARGVRPSSIGQGDPPADPRRRYFLRTATYAAGALPLAGA